MKPQDHAALFKREVLVRLVKAFLTGDLKDNVDRIPVDMRPKDAPSVRCCIYKERAVARSRCLAGMGLSIGDSDDARSLGSYAEEALQRESLQEPVLTVIDIACKGCVPARYVVTEYCQACLARPCAVNCPFGAIDVDKGRSHIDPMKCKSCGKCAEACPYHAITKIVVPCEEACPVHAINKNELGVAEIDPSECTSCGRCMRACPFGAVQSRSQILDVLRKIKEGKKLVAMLAPAIAGQFPVSLGKVAQGLKKLGFYDVIEVAHGADVTTRNEAKELVERLKNGAPFMTTSCCPAYYETVKRHIPELLPYVSSTRTPMHYTAEIVKNKDPEALAVFIGPCMAKKYEGIHDELVDYVLSFEELGALFDGFEIDLNGLEEMDLGPLPSKEGRAYAVTTGVAGAVKVLAEKEGIEVKPVYINGLHPASIRQLKAFVKAGCPGNMVEVMVCEGGCVAGPTVLGNPRTTARDVKTLSEQAPGIDSIKGELSS